MTDTNASFRMVGIIHQENMKEQKKRKEAVPWLSFIIMGIIILGCLMANVITTKDPAYLDLMNYTKAPCREFLFGTDTLGRDLFSCIWYGGRISLFIGFFATLISTMLAIVYGSVSGFSSDWVDTFMMRLTEIFLSVPGLLLTIFIQAVLGKASVFSISLVIGITSWYSIAKVIRTEVRQIRKSEYVIAAQCMGGNFFYIMWKHLVPNFFSAIMFMAVMNVRSAIVAESTLSYMGIGLPLEVISWGSLLSNAERALMTKAWWIILIPGLFLVVMLVCLTNVGNWLRMRANRKESNL